jgi:hypothetical protein
MCISQKECENDCGVRIYATIDSYDHRPTLFRFKYINDKTYICCCEDDHYLAMVEDVLTLIDRIPQEQEMIYIEKDVKFKSIISFKDMNKGYFAC